MKKSKKKSEFQHAVRRARERFGIEIKQHDMDSIVALIKNSQGVHLYKQSERVSHWLIRYRECDMIACYDKNRGMVITFLTVEMYDVSRYTFCSETKIYVENVFKNLGVLKKCLNQKV